MGYGAVFDVERPARFERVQVLLRLLLLLVLTYVGAPLGWLFFVVYLVVPLVAAIYVSSQGEGYLHAGGPTVAAALRWIVGFAAYIALLTDRFPSRDDPAVTFEVRPGGRPTVGSALLRLLFTLPGAILLWLLSIVSGLVWIVAAVAVLVRARVPGALYDFQRGVVRWLARLLAYHASLVDDYPPIALDTGPEPTPV